MTFIDNISGFFSKLGSLSFGITDLLDIALISFVVYNAIKLIRETRAFQLVKGLLLLAVAYLLINQLDMQTSSYIFRFLFQNVFIILVILFQQEIRQVIEKVGNSKFTSLSLILKGSSSDKEKAINDSINEISKAVQRMSDSKTGSLIVMERQTLLGDVIESGKPVDAFITHELIGNIFFPKSPLHDGAAIVRNGRLVAAGCVLPLTKSTDVSSDLGTRHRAALGMSEQSDAAVIVVSEETGIISLAYQGTLERNLTDSELREKLINLIIDKPSDNIIDNDIFKKIFKGKKDGKKKTKNK